MMASNTEGSVIYINSVMTDFGFSVEKIVILIIYRVWEDIRCLEEI